MRAIRAEKERGCRRFDVLEPAGEPDRVVLYEIYDDRAAFDAHLQSEHFRRFNAESNALVAQEVDHRMRARLSKEPPELSK